MQSSRFSTTLFLWLIFTCVHGQNREGMKSLDSKPVLTVQDIQLARTKMDTTVTFMISLSEPSKKPAKIKYRTVSGSAKAGKEFKASRGSVTVPAGALQARIDIVILGDSLRQDDLFFTLELTGARNCILAKPSATATVVNRNNTYLPTDDAGYSTPLHYPGRRLVWNDEFNSDRVDLSSWNFETGGNGWGNKELENYTTRPDNVFVSGGNLIIEARRENYGSNLYTSARMTTKGKREFQFGRVDIRAKLPVGNGIWPALWMLGSNISTTHWPACGEIDIMELIGKYPSRIYGTLHFADSSGKHAQAGTVFNLPGEDFSKRFHVFSLLWQRDSIQIMVDDQPYFNYVNTKGKNPFNAPFFFLFNVAVGGQFPGNPDALAAFPERMFVDYIRVYN